MVRQPIIVSNKMKLKCTNLSLSLSRVARASLVSKHMSSLLVILNKQLLRHQFLDASHTMEAITMAMDQVPDVVRKVKKNKRLPSIFFCARNEKQVTRQALS